MEQMKHDGATEMVPPVTVARAKEASVRRHRATTQPATIGKLHGAREAVRDFLVHEVQAREVRITKIGPSAADPPGWYAEAEILVPDLGIMTLGLDLSQEVLERQLYAVDLDGELAVKSYEVVDQRER